jgi:SAM-dependent methyltransferase
MSDQSHYWSLAAADYEAEFVDPYRASAVNPLLPALEAIDDARTKTVADLGCGIGPLLPVLSARFGHVIAVDFAPGMLDRARQRCHGLKNIEFLAASMTNLAELNNRLDVAVAVNSLIGPDVTTIEACLSAIHRALRPGGMLLGIVPAMDAVHYHTMLLVDRARRTGMPEAAAHDNAARHAEHELYDFAFGGFRYRGLCQHFWQPFEIAYRLRRAGFRAVRKAKVRLPWEQFACASDLRGQPAPWDWFFSCRVPAEG